jgi:FtsP/CotA-like multicopper oxidase with cupredoxin domain
MEPNETADLAFVADYPSDGMLRRHVTDHWESGMMAVIRVCSALLNFWTVY